ncbi:unnamed protein product [Moneuplotes crassus]|uniref:Cyclic nucleotide-binding domain-containing protein n=1 Tax=Euplotes crassus TaxID=5936 RepID=A0AAD1XVZ2_EUPCR|nr:unnamed protein product [Moneuplotes crassus]
MQSFKRARLSPVTRPTPKRLVRSSRKRISFSTRKHQKVEKILKFPRNLHAVQQAHNKILNNTKDGSSKGFGNLSISETIEKSPHPPADDYLLLENSKIKNVKLHSVRSGFISKRVQTGRYARDLQGEIADNDYNTFSILNNPEAPNKSNPRLFKIMNKARRITYEASKDKRDSTRRFFMQNVYQIAKERKQRKRDARSSSATQSITSLSSRGEIQPKKTRNSEVRKSKGPEDKQSLSLESRHSHQKHDRKVLNLSLKPCKIFSQTELDNLEVEKSQTTPAPVKNKYLNYPVDQNKVNNYFEDPEYWMYRGEILKRKNNIDGAINNYKSLKGNLSLHFSLGTSYMQKKQYERALAYFRSILEQDASHVKSHFCLTLSLFRLERYEAALDHIDKVLSYPLSKFLQIHSKIPTKSPSPFSKTSKNSLKKLKLPQNSEIYSWICLRGMCYKQLGIHENAKTDLEYLKSFSPVKTLDELLDENRYCPSYKEIYIRDKKAPHVLLTKDFYIEGDGWRNDGIPEAVEVLREVTFFSKFCYLDIKAYISKMWVKTYEAQQLILVPNDTACIVMGGYMKFHKFNCKTKESMLCKLLFQGDFVFNSNSFRPPIDFWLETITPVELLFMKKVDFEVLWELMKQKSTQYVVDFLKEHFLFCTLSKQTKYLLAYDVLTIKKFRKGDKILSFTKLSDKAISASKEKSHRLRKRFIDANHLLSEKLKKAQKYADEGLHDKIDQLVHIDNYSDDSGEAEEIMKMVQKQDELKRLGFQKSAQKFAQSRKIKHKNISISGINSGLRKDMHKSPTVGFIKNSTTLTPSYFENELRKLEVPDKEMETCQKSQIKFIINEIMGEFLFDKSCPNPSISDKIDTDKVFKVENDYIGQDGIYIVDKGKCSLVFPNEDTLVAKLGKYDFFGPIFYLEMIKKVLFTKDLTTITVVADTQEVTCLFFSMKRFGKIPKYERPIVLKLFEKAAEMYSKKIGC